MGVRPFAHLVFRGAPIDALPRPGGVVVTGAGGRLHLTQQAAETGRVGDGRGLERGGRRDEEDIQSKHGFQPTYHGKSTYHFV